MAYVSHSPDLLLQDGCVTAVLTESATCLQFIYLSIYLFIYLSIYLSIHPSTHPSIHLSIYLYLRICVRVYLDLCS